MSLQEQTCSAFGGCGKRLPVQQFYAGIPGLCITCADSLVKTFQVTHHDVHYASFAIECSVQAEKKAWADTKAKLGPDKAAAGTLRLDSGLPESLRRLGQKSFLGALLKLADEAPHDRERAQACYRQFEAWVRKQYGVD
jgi:hypothetical protein